MQKHKVFHRGKVFVCYAFLITFSLFLQLTVQAQNGNSKKVDLKVSNIPLAAVLKMIEEKADVVIMYELTQKMKTEKITIDVRNKTVGELLDLMTEGRKLKWDFTNNVFRIVKVPEEKSNSGESKSMTTESEAAKTMAIITGKIVGLNNQPLEGATIRIKGTGNIIISDNNGNFSIEAVEGSVLVISYVGYKEREYRSGSGAAIIELTPLPNSLDTTQVIVSTGYQFIPKDRATGSFVQIDNKLLNRSMSSNLLDRFMHVTSSLKFETAGGGSDSRISIRGFSTINASKKPLIVVDGFIYEENDSWTNDVSQILLNNINPNDVESITILRDAAAASIWGARSANGVIVITTKRGKFNQRPGMSFSSTIMLTEKPRLNKMKLLKAADIIELEKERFAAGGMDIHDDQAENGSFPALTPVAELLLTARKRNRGIPGYDALQDPDVLAALDLISQHDVRNDISKYLLQTGLQQQYSLNLSGGTDKMNYYASVGFNTSNPIERGNHNEELSIRFNNSFRPIKKIEITTDLTYNRRLRRDNTEGYSKFMPGSSNTRIYTSLADAKGNPLIIAGDQRLGYIDTLQQPGLLDWYYRPLEELRYRKKTNNDYGTILRGTVSYQPVQSVKMVLSGSYSKSLSTYNDYRSLKSYDARNLINSFMFVDDNGVFNYPVPIGGILDYKNDEQTNWTVNTQFSYDNAWGIHQVNASIATEANEVRFNSMGARKYGYDPDLFTDYEAIDFKTGFPVRGSYAGSILSIPNSESFAGTLTRRVSYFANIGYIIANKYIFTSSARVDGSNLLGSSTNRRLTPLWSSGFTWKIVKENFCNVKGLSDLSFTVTYGYNGNMDNQLTALPTIALSRSDGKYHRELIASLLSPGNPHLRWEKVGNVNMRIDYGVWNNRISGSVDSSVKRGIDLLGSIQVEPTTGVTSYTGNYASLVTRGLDFAINSQILNRKLGWHTTLNISYNSDKVIDYQQSEFQTNYTFNYLGTNDFVVLNKSLKKIYSYPDAGLDPLNGAPRGYVDGKIESFEQVLNKAKPSDLKFHGSATPLVFGNMTHVFTYNQFSLFFNLSFRLNYYFRKKSLEFRDIFNIAYAHYDYYNRWQKPGDELNVKVPARPDRLDSRDNFYTYSEALIFRADNIALTDLTISYSLNRSKYKKLPCKEASFNIGISNLGIIWAANIEGLNPDNRSDVSMVPASRNLTFKLAVNF